MSDKAAVSSVTAADSVYRHLRLCVTTTGVCNVKNAKLLYQISSYTVNYVSDGEHIVLFYHIHYIESWRVIVIRLINIDFYWICFLSEYKKATPAI